LTDEVRRYPAVFLDRDGTLNVEKGGLRKPEDLELLPGVGAALRRLREGGYRLVVLTNQSVIARGEASETDVAAIHRRLEQELAKEGAYLDGIYLCPHHPERGVPGERPELKIACECRKPGIGLLTRAAEELHLDLMRSWMVGDQPTDIQMARRAFLRCVFIVHDRGRLYPADFIAGDLAVAANIILLRGVVAAR
jgi:D,D-heptose 1,7-bisphosphate phosphatase